MKYLRLYEDIDNEPKVGDYVYVNWSFREKRWENYINEHIGQIIEISSRFPEYKIKYYVNDEIYEELFKDDEEEDLIEYEGDKRFITMRLSRYVIKEFSPDRELLKTMLAVNKYNL